MIIFQRLFSFHEFAFVIMVALLTTSLISVNGLQNHISNYAIANVNSANSQYLLIQDDVSLAQLYAIVRDSVVMVQGLTRNSGVQGSGFVYDHSGRIVVITNYHVVNGASNISVTFRNGHAYAAVVSGHDTYSDLAVLSVVRAPTSEFKPLQVVSSSTLQVGDYVIAIGNPLGLTGSITTGIVSALGRTISESTSNFPIADAIQTSALVNPGNSGGPLLNNKGQVVGINTVTLTGSQGISLAVSSNTILREIASLVTTGSYDKHSFLGITRTDMTYYIANKMGLNLTYGVLVENISAGGPASKAGLKGSTTKVTIAGDSLIIGGDVITAINGTSIINSDDLSTYLEENTQPNQTIILSIIRLKGNIPIQVDLPVVLGTRPPLT